MTAILARRPRLAYPFTVIPQQDAVLLVAGEDLRYTLTDPGLDRWLPALLDKLDGSRSLDFLLSEMDEAGRLAAATLLERLYGERVLVDGSAQDAHQPARYRLQVEGDGPLCDLIREHAPVADAPGSPIVGMHDMVCAPIGGFVGNALRGVPGSASDLVAPRNATEGVPYRSIVVLCQDRLDYAAALELGRRCRQEKLPWLWVSQGAMRGYVGPLFLPDAGPCFGCLLRSFQRLSPAPEIYDALLDQAKNDRPITPVPFPAEGLAVLAELVRWKLGQAAASQPAAGLYRLHALELESMEVGSHRVFVDPLCPYCCNGELASRAPLGAG